jgi:hypothetical protein
MHTGGRQARTIALMIRIAPRPMLSPNTVVGYRQSVVSGRYVIVEKLTTDN